ncbi:MAG TPA: hypothetical protein HA294_03215 [Nanoarchaeota archaeon]|nr:hypothetical protein [Candidatus Woesearchaeota archaeon]HIH15359.1 hypothetical protein [Nanoarchaeota archaeon]HIH58993.1 hypothetical protein [Nanoarchaeota archaeon]HIJ05480.1 hypothetical protein [Nanoarchaeota archaeon]
MHLVLLLSQENPQPDLLLLLDCPAQLALERIVQRAKKGGKPLSRFENLSDLTLFRERYHMLTGIFPKTRVIDSSKPFCEVWNDIESVILEGVLNGRL